MQRGSVYGGQLSVLTKYKPCTDMQGRGAGYDCAKRTNEGFRFMSNKEERVRLAAEQNSNLDTSPTQVACENKSPEQLMKLRERVKSKELGAPFFRHKAHNYLEKLKDHIRNKNASTAIQTSEQFNKTMLDKLGRVRNNLVPLMPKMKEISTLKKRR